MLLLTPTPSFTVVPTQTPTATTVPQNGHVVYVYDGDGNLVKSFIGDVVTYYPNGAYELKVSGSNEVITKYYSAGSSRIAYRINGAITWLLNDHLGSTVGIVDANGELIGTLKYTAYGELRTGSSTTDYRYTGQREESEIGLYYYVARMYDPALERFISADTIVPDPGRSQEYDRFSYVSNNPINRNDPSGHIACEEGDSDCENAGKVFSYEDYINWLKLIYGWNIIGDFSLVQLKEIVNAGSGIEKHMNGISDGFGQEWVSSVFGGTTFERTEGIINQANKLGASAFVWTFNSVNFGEGFVESNTIIHELGHVLDNVTNSDSIIPATVLGGGAASEMIRAMGGHPWKNLIKCIPLTISFEVSNQSYHDLIAGNDAWPVEDYANHGVADDFAETFMHTILGEMSPLGARIGWMEAYLRGLSN